MEVKNIYKNYDKRVQEYMQNVVDCLEQDYGKIPASWRISLDLIADNYSVYLKAMDDVNENGLLRKDKQNRTFKNQCYNIADRAQSHLKDLLKSFALTPMSRSKMRELDSEEIDADEYISTLVD